MAQKAAKAHNVKAMADVKVAQADLNIAVFLSENLKNRHTEGVGAELHKLKNIKEEAKKEAAAADAELAELDDATLVKFAKTYSVPFLAVSVCRRLMGQA